MGDEKPSGFTLRSNPRVRVTFDAPNQTECAGVVLLSELMRRIEWDEHLERHLPFQRARGMVGYPTQVLLKQIVIAIALGARRPEQIEIVREDDAPRVVSGDEATASSVTVWRHLKEYTAETYGRLRAFRTAITGELLTGWRGPLDVDTDGTVVTLYGDQEGAVKGYNPEHRGKKSYFPLVTMATGPGLVLSQKMRPGNSGAAAGDTDLLTEAYESLPAPLRQRMRSRLDCGHYGDATMQWHEQRRMPYAIKARQTGPLMARVADLTWKPEAFNGRDVAFAEFYYRLSGTLKDRKVAAMRWPRKVRDAQGRMFQEETYEYELIMTNLRVGPRGVFEFYNQRGQAETLISDVKEMGLGLAVTDEMLANEVWSELVVIAYNLVAALRRQVQKKQGVRPKSRTFRDRFLNVAATLVRHARIVWIRFKEGWSRAAQFERLWAYAAGPP